MNAVKKPGRISKYAIIEIIFFIVFFFLFPIFTDIEYKLKENPCAECDNDLSNIIIQRIVFGFFQLLPFIFLYKILLHKLLLKKKYAYFLVSFILFLFALDLYIVYVEYWTISRLYFLPENITSNAAKWFKVKELFHFSVVFIINQMLVFTALAYFINYARQEERMNALTKAKLEADLNYLKAQMQPHFFFNTLNNIYSLAQKRSADTAPLVAKLSEMMRYIIYETAHPKVLLSKEIDFLKNYVDVESIRYNKIIVISFDTQGINKTDTIEPLLLLPFIENMFKHGVQEETGKGFVEIIICMTGNELILQAKNSKPSVKSSEQKLTGIGLANTKKRLELLYPGKYDLAINDAENNFEAFLKIVLN